jgi:4-amino-4-deoxy-L-arabinose transferase-like glycosyltransferase
MRQLNQLYQRAASHMRSGLHPLWLLALALAVSGAMVVFWVTRSFGPGTEADSATYLAAARHLRMGHGFADIDGSPLTIFPPGFPAAVAVFEWLGVGSLAGARVLGVAAFGLLVAVVVIWTGRATSSLTLTAVIGVVTTLSVPLVGMASSALSEPLFALLVILGLVFLAAAVDSGRPRWMLAAAAVSGAAELTRYTGIVLVPTGIVVLVLASPGGTATRLRRALAFGGVALAPLVLWLVRNDLASGVLFGEYRGRSSLTLLASAKANFAALGNWFSPASLPATVRALLAVLLLALACAPVIVVAWGEQRGGRCGTATMALPAAVFVALYVPAMIALQASTALDPPPRFLLPAFAPLAVAVGAVLALGARPAPVRGRRPSKDALAVALAVAACLPRLAGFIETSQRTGLVPTPGTPAYSTAAWRNSPLLDDLRSHPLVGHLWSDDPFVLSLRLGLVASLTPERTYYRSPEPTDNQELQDFVHDTEDSMPVFVIWTTRSSLPNYYTVEDLRRAACLVSLRHFPDGDIYQSCRSVVGPLVRKP